MHPVLLEFKGIAIHSYGLLLAIAFISALLLSSREARLNGINPDRIMDLGFYVILSAIIGARLFHVLVFHEIYTADPLEIFRIWNGGLVFYGGLILAIPVAIIYIRKQGLPLWKVSDVVASSLPLGLSIGRIGCFMAGCCYGKPTDLPWGVIFSNPRSLARAHLGEPVHPTQLYESSGSFLIFIFIFFYLRKRKHFDGELFWTFTLLYSAMRFFLEFLRDDPRGFLFGFSESQIVGVPVFIVSIFMLLYLKKLKRVDTIG